MNDLSNYRKSYDKSELLEVSEGRSNSLLTHGFVK
jgi:hypothetical protein